MFQQTYSDHEIGEITRAAEEFSHQNHWTLPCVFRGNPVANAGSACKARSFSTIHKIFQTSEGHDVYLACAYPMAVVHRALDGLARLLTGKYCIKPLSLRRWKQAFAGKSFIQIIPVGVRNVVAMTFVPNENFRDILASFVGNYGKREKEAMIMAAVALINRMHEDGVVWGDLLVINMVRSAEGEIVLCNTETHYYRGTLAEQKASDWLDFICSCCGDLERAHPGTWQYIVRLILEGIQDQATRARLRDLCKRKIGLLHRLFFFYTKARLSTPFGRYVAIREQIARS